MERHKLQGSTSSRASRLLELAAIVAVALGAHVLALQYVADAMSQPSASEAAPARIVALSRAEVERLRRARRTKNDDRAAQPREQHEKKNEAEPEKLSGEVVEVAPSPTDEPPEHARYLSERNTRTERETKSRYRDDYENVMNERTVAKRSELSSPSPQRDAAALEIGPERPARERHDKGRGPDDAFELPRVRERQRLALRLDPELGRLRNQSASERLEGTSDRLRLSLGEPSDEAARAGSAPHKGARAIELVPQLGVLASLTGGPMSEHLEDVEEGEGTFLNTREFKYASFFNRMKRGVRQHWRWEEEYRRRDPTGNIYGFRSRVTVLFVTLNADGSLKQLELLRSSGVDFLDYEAMAAIKRAEPFPNPPRGLVENGQIAFPFSFHIEFRPGGLF